MNNKLKKTVATVVISASLMTTGYAAFAADAPVNGGVPAVVTYKLTDSLDVEVKGVLNQRVDEGSHVGVFVKLTNNSANLVRVPDYEVRITTNDGLEYTLKPSANNLRSIKPKSTVELAYADVIDRTDSFSLSSVNWTDVDYYVYPKKETRVLGVQIQGQAWKGNETPITDPAAVKKWSETFKIPSLVSPIEYTPVGISKESTDKGTLYVVQLLAKNPTDLQEAIPAFGIDGKAGDKVFSGKRVEESDIVLNAKQEKYIHYSILTDKDAKLSSLNILTPEKYGVAAEKGITNLYYKVGRLNVLLPTQLSSGGFAPYTLGAPISFDKRSDLISKDLEVSVIQFQLGENKEEGSKNVIAKFKLTNKGTQPLEVPNFKADLISSDGYEYTGKRQKTSEFQSIQPGSSVTINYAYDVPLSENGKGLAIKVKEEVDGGSTSTSAAQSQAAGAAQAGPSIKSTIAAFKLDPQELEKDHIKVYPFDAKVTYFTVGYTYTQATDYVYNAKFSVSLKREEQVQVDGSFSKLLFELYDSKDRLIGTATKGFVGTKRLTDGENTIVFDGVTSSSEFPLSIRVYETFETDRGEAKHLIGNFKQ